MQGKALPGCCGQTVCGWPCVAGPSEPTGDAGVVGLEVSVVVRGTETIGAWAEPATLTAAAGATPTRAEAGAWTAPI